MHPTLYRQNRDPVPPTVRAYVDRGTSLLKQLAGGCRSVARKGYRADRGVEIVSYRDENKVARAFFAGWQSLGESASPARLLSENRGNDPKSNTWIEPSLSNDRLTN